MNKRIENIISSGKLNEQGSVLIAVLIVLSSLIILSLGLTYRTRTEMDLAFNHAKRTQSYYLALGGIERIKALLTYDEELNPLIVTQICQFNNSTDGENLFEQVPEFSANENMNLSYALRDEYGYLSVNASDPASWENINIFDKGIYASIVDWIDGDNDINPNGAESDYYNTLEKPYVSKNSPVVTLGELLYVKGVTRRLYIGEDLNRDGILNDSESDGYNELPFDNEDSELDYGLVDIFTVYGNGKININTASKRVISSMAGLDGQVGIIINSYITGPDGTPGTDDDKCISSPEDIALIEGLSEIQISLLQDYCCYDSRIFRIFSTARISKTNKCALMATVEIKDSELKILDIERLL